MKLDRLPDVFRVFDTAADFVAAARCCGQEEGSAHWAGGTLADAVKYCERGDVAAVGNASALADSVNDAVDLAGARTEWAADVVGAFANVPAFLSGDPCSMWARQPAVDERGTLDVFVNGAASGCVTAKDLAKGGACVLAAVLALQRVRNVRLTVYYSSRYVSHAVRMSTPFDVSEICAFLTRPAVFRQLEVSQLAKAACCNVGHYDKIPWAKWSAVITGDESTERRAVLDALAPDGRGLVLTPAKIGSWAKLSRADFIAHVNDLVRMTNEGEI